MKSDPLHFIAGIVPFSFLPQDRLKTTATRLTVQYYPRDTILFVQGQSKIDQLYIIQKGAAERYYEEKDQKILRGLLGEGDIYGGISMLINDSISLRSLRVTEDTCFYLLPKLDFLDLCKAYPAFSEYFTDTFGKRMLDKSYAEIIVKNVRQKDAPAFLNQPVSSICGGHPVVCDMDMSIQDAATLMSRRDCSSVFVRKPPDHFVGIVTDNDLRNKVIAKGYDISKPVSRIMSSPLYAVSANALVFEALMIMMQKNIKHLAVSGENDTIIGAVSNQDLLSAQGRSPLFLIRQINTADSISEIIDKHSQLPRLVQGLINRGAKAKNVTRLITTISDAILNKLIKFALDELGPPPARFVFMIMGSEGRNEQTLKTDQDNAILYEDVPRKKEEQVKDYFLRFGEKVCADLDRAGYAFCTGDIMAKNPRWCQSMSAWKEAFTQWIRGAQPEALLQASIFFDFRGAYGNLRLTDSLRKYLFIAMRKWAGFFRHLTENALHIKPPIGFFRNFLVESKGENRNTFDIKSAMMPIVDFARIYALYHRILETNTLDRLYQLHLRKVLPWEEYNEIEKAYSYLMQLRFARQVTAVMDEQGKPDNHINPKKLSRIEQTMLKEIFKRIEKIQARLESDFTGLSY